MKKNIAFLYKTARRYLNLSQKEVANELGVSDMSISKIERGHTQSPNHEYTKYLVEKGINYFYLIGLSDQIEGQAINCDREDYKSLVSENENLKAELENLKQEMEETVSRSEFEEVTHKLEAYAEIIRMLKNEKS